MSRGVNHFHGIGNLTRDPETRYSQAGNAVTKFSIAINEKFGETERVEYVNVVTFKRLAEIAGQYLHKGSKVYVEGSLRTDSWEKDGQKRYKTEVVARELQMLDGRPQGQQAAPVQQPAATESFDDEVPFVWIVGLPFIPALMELANGSQNLL